MVVGSTDRCESSVCSYKSSGFLRSMLYEFQLTATYIKGKASELALQLKIDNFACTDGWLNRFKTRKGIFSAQTVRWRCKCISKSAINDWYPVLEEILKKYAPRDVYNTDKSAFYYNLLLDKTGGEGWPMLRFGSGARNVWLFSCVPTWMAVIRLSHL
jgi:hypothetical protein